MMYIQETLFAPFVVVRVFASTDAHTAQQTNSVSKGYTSAVEHPYKYTRLFEHT